MIQGTDPVRGGCKRRRLTVAVASLVSVGGLLAGGLAIADGTETLGPPSIALADGSGLVAAGVGLETQPAMIDITVPAGASVQQVLLYWEGMNSTASGDDTISMGGVSVTGVLIGGPTFFFTNPFGDHYSSTYRADVTALGLVSDGANSIAIDGADFDQVNDGAGLLVIYDDGSESEISIVDGNDLAFFNFAPPLDTTVAQTFNFTAEPVDRQADLTMFFASVAGPVVPGDRPSVIEVTVDGVVTEYIDVLSSADGDEWDTFTATVNVPAGVSQLTVQALSEDRNATGFLPASFAWNLAALDLPVTPTTTTTTTTTMLRRGGEGCTPGYWKQRHHLDSWVGYAPGDSFEVVFGVDASFDKTLLGALSQGGGGEKALGRHAVAALLNSAAGGVDYAYSTAEVIALVQSAYSSGDFNGVKDLLEAENEEGCPLN